MYLEDSVFRTWEIEALVYESGVDLMLLIDLSVENSKKSKSARVATRLRRATRLILGLS